MQEHAHSGATGGQDQQMTEMDSIQSFEKGLNSKRFFKITKSSCFSERPDQRTLREDAPTIFA